MIDKNSYTLTDNLNKNGNVSYQEQNPIDDH